LHRFLLVAFGAVLMTIVGLFIWAVASNGGAPTPPPSITVSDSARKFKMLQAVSSVAGAWTGSAIRSVNPIRELSQSYAD